MANKYGIFGAAANGDGTASNEAASDGAAGAWKIDQTAGNILLGTAPTYGLLNPGDTVFIRSKTGNGVNANITVSFSTAISLGSASATTTAPITWVLDDGTVWSGVDGTLSFMDGPSTNVSVVLRDFNHFISATKHKWIFGITNTASNGATLLSFGTGYSDGLFQDAGMSSTSGRRVALGTSKNHYARNFKLKTAHMDFNGAIGMTDNVLVFDNLDWEHAITPASGVDSKKLIKLNSSSARLMFLGGRLYGAGISDNTPFISGFSSKTCSIIGVGFTFPRTLIDPAANTDFVGTNVVAFTGSDGGLGGVLSDRWGQLDSRNDGNYPYLNAVLPNSSATGWSWRVVPSASSLGMPAVVPVCNKLYTSAAATKTITLEALISTGFTGLDNSNCFATFTYIDDSTGVPVNLTTYNPAGGALTGSTADWYGEISDTQAGWGATTLNKIKFAVTTPSSIKQDTQIAVQFYLFATQPLATDVVFLDPDVQLT